MFRPSKKQVDLMKHALGLDRGETDYRNHFCAEEGHEDYEDLLELCREGLMYRVTIQPNWVEGQFFMVNNEGKAYCKGIRK